MTSPSSPVDSIAKAMEGVTPGPWKVFDGCSWRRIGTTGRDGHDCAVLAPTKASDGHPDLTCASGNDLYANLNYIAACSPDRMREVLDVALQLEAMQREMAEKDERIAALEAGIRPFSKYAGVVFERNFNNSDPVDTMTATDGAVSTLYARDFFTARILIQGEKK